MTENNRKEMNYSEIVASKNRIIPYGEKVFGYDDQHRLCQIRETWNPEDTPITSLTYIILTTDYPGYTTIKQKLDKHLQGIDNPPKPKRRKAA